MRTSSPLALAIAACLGTATMDAAAADLWRDASPSAASATARGADTDLPSRHRAVLLDRTRLDVTMRGASTAPPEKLELPLPDGGSTTFRLEDAGVLPDALAARYPRLQSLKGVDATGRKVRLDIGPDGVHAAVRDAGGDWIVRPESAMRATGRAVRHAVFRKADATRQAWSEPEPTTLGPMAAPPMSARGTTAGPAVLRTFRIAMGASSSYTAHMGGTVEDGLAGVVRTVNRINEIFENDVGVHFVLAEQSDRLVFTTAGDDPYEAAGTESSQILARHVEVAREKVGDANFDVGHVLDGRRNAGEAGALGNTCVPWSGDPARRHLSKAAGMTGSARPFGDPFHVDFVAHELGHQFGAHHTFNGCFRGDPTSAFEPGSGSTIMGYAGICGAHNLQKHSDPYFHAASIEQMQRWLATVGGECAATRANTSLTPVIDTNGWRNPLFVPARTPFTLRGSASFADPGARLTYTFEQMDHGNEQRIDQPLADVGVGPLFRARAPDPSGEQTFPAMAVLLGDEPKELGDVLPKSDRDMRFRLTVRDNMDHRSHVVGAERHVRVVDTGEAFEMLAPVAGATLKRGAPRQVRWNVAGTTDAPIRCARVDIHLSVDGGASFLDAPLARSVANKGRATVTIPGDIEPTRRARLRVRCANGSFFALSADDVTIR
ncbi:Metallo-peptidase family M12B Reprolysin-like [Luteibacter sp. UNCMF331Sha3.1]|uniref:reprolysin-like metallopeptidase n=1 Tax=Luteibacter sp. UNCMF331Sha3.1 TaxID=1502760 RepID=UPI0008CC73B7|nr:zinc-dependent metalloprotease family protein [Luteibacter sp. UNCMF331Sha3.1]SEN41069.1 Metallo-peptidase family M12B Reprolysin-like [Luteibacter sp. UNCMF331Sha3.1]